MGYRPPINEFNATAMPSQEMLRRLMAVALYGNETLHSVFSALADRAGNTERGRATREKEVERIASFMRTVMATQERIAEFQRKLDMLERASYEALIENEERLAAARDELDRIREQAMEVTMPDGTAAKVYRDGDKVRDDDGTEVSPEIIRPDDISPGRPDWQQRRAIGNEIDDLARQRRDIIEFRERLDQAREKSSGDQIVEEELSVLEKELGDMPEPVTRHLPSDSPASRQPAFTPPTPGASAPAPK
jgi:hypothetical protein